MSNIHDSLAYKEGRQSYFANKGGYENPYPLGSIEYDAFERGWSQALKKTPEVITRKMRKTKTQATQEEAMKELRINKSKEAYLKGKGY